MTLAETVTAAVNDFTTRGYVSPQQLSYWVDRLRKAAEGAMMPPEKMRETLNASLRAIYQRLVERGQVLRNHDGVSRFTIDRLRPQLRMELDRRIMASADLIKLNRDAAIEKTIQRFSGWATSIPVGGSKAVDRVDTKLEVKKSLKQLPFAERRVIIDQGHKLVSAINNVVATDGGAVAVIWHSHWRQPGYNFRKDHKERDEHLYTIRGNWALERGLMRKGPDGYYEDVTSFGEEPFCRCYGQYVYTLAKLPDAMITKRGKAELAWARERAVA